MTIPSARVPKCPECSSARVLRYLECPSSLRALGASSPAYLGYPSVLSGLSARVPWVPDCLTAYRVPKWDKMLDFCLSQ